MRSAAAERCRRKFLRFFPGGFRDETYREWERNYKAAAARAWQSVLSREQFRLLLNGRRFTRSRRNALRIKSHTNLLFSFEKMALRDATANHRGCARFAVGLYDFLYGEGDPADRLNGGRGGRAAAAKTDAHYDLARSSPCSA